MLFSRGGLTFGGGESSGGIFPGGGMSKFSAGVGELPTHPHSRESPVLYYKIDMNREKT